MTIQSTVKLTDDQEKAMALIREGKRHTLLYGGSRCVSGDSKIDGYTETIAELALIGKPIIVRTSHGYKIAKAPFCKGVDYLYSFVTESGKEIKVTDDHLFYDGTEWKKAREFSVGSFLAVQSCAPCPRRSSLALCLSVSLLNALHLIHIPQDWQANCYKYRRRYDEQLHSDGVGDQACYASSCDAAARGYKLEKIVSISKTTTAEKYYTTTVNISHQYFANGFLNHNSGKTFLIVLCIVLRALMYPGSRHLIYRLRLKDSIQSIWLETLPKVVSLFVGLSRYVKANETRHVMEFPNGSEIWVAGVDDARSEDSVLGKEYVTIYANEASQIPYMTMWKVRTRLAQKVEGCTVREFVDLNPTTRAHWTYKEFVQKIDPVHSKPGDTRPVDDPESYAWSRMNPNGNVANLDADYIRSLQNAPESMRRRFYEGEYACDDSLLVFPFPDASYYAGKQFDDWVREVGPGNVRLAAGLDLGFEDADGFAIVAYVPRVHDTATIPRDAMEAARLGRYSAPEVSASVTKRWLIYEYKARRSGLSELAKAVQAGLDWAERRARELNLSSANILIYSDTGGGGAKMVYDLRTVYKLPVVAAYKRDKKAAIELLQDDVREGRFMVPADGAFAQEAQAIVWTKDPETGEVIREIDDRQYHPDLMDAILYAMRAVWVQSLSGIK